MSQATCCPDLHAGTGVTRLTGSTPNVVRINVHDDRSMPIGHLEVEVDPHGADFRPTGMLRPLCTGRNRFQVSWCSLACDLAEGATSLLPELHEVSEGCTSMWGVGQCHVLSSGEPSSA